LRRCQKKLERYPTFASAVLARAMTSREGAAAASVLALPEQRQVEQRRGTGPSSRAEALERTSRGVAARDAGLPAPGPPPSAPAAGARSCNGHEPSAVAGEVTGELARKNSACSECGARCSRHFPAHRCPPRLRRRTGACPEQSQRAHFPGTSPAIRPPAAESEI
jgi:hypothetical protein